MDGLQEAFRLDASDLAHVEILLASYGSDEVEGEAFVLLTINGSLYEVNASHDPGGNLEGQWEPELTRFDALRYRLVNGRLGCSHPRNRFAEQLRVLLTRLSPLH